MAWVEQGKHSPAGFVKEDAVEGLAAYASRTRCILIVGGVGSGKSTVGNTLIGKDAFQVGSNLFSSTRKAEMQEVFDQRKWLGHLKVLYTPSLPHVVDQLEEHVLQWKKMIGPFPDVILLVIKLARYSLEEYDAYVKMKEAWGQEDFCQRLVVVFTQCTNLEHDLKDLLSSFPPKMQGILRDAQFRCVLFDEDQLPPHKEAFLRSVMRQFWLVREAGDGLKADESKLYRDEVLEVFGQLDKNENKDIREFLKEKNRTRQKEAEEVLEILSKNEAKKPNANDADWTCRAIVIVGVLAAIALVVVAAVYGRLETE